MREPGATADRQYRIKLIVDSLQREIGPTLPLGRERLILDTACALIGDLVQDRDANDVHLGATLLSEAPGLAAACTANSGRDPALATIARAVASNSVAPATRSRLQSYLRSIAASLDSELESAPSLRSAYELSARGSLVHEPQARVTPRVALENYLRGTALIDGASAVSVKRLSSGMSKETYMAEFVAASGAKRRVIVRKDSGFSCLMTSVVDEFPLLTMLHARGLPVPQPLCCESDIDICGTPFMVMQAVDGTSDPGRWADREHMRGIALHLIEFLANLHAVPIPTLLPVLPPWLDPNHLCRSVAGLRRAWDSCGFSDEPLLDAVVAWLEVNEPHSSAPQVLVHADAGFHNLLIADDSIAAVLDWETCHMGYAEEDLLTLRPFLEPVMPWSDVLSTYRSYGGRCDGHFHPAFYTTFVLARTAVSLFNIRAAMRDGNAAVDARDAYIGTRYSKRLVAEAFKTVAASGETAVGAER